MDTQDQDQTTADLSQMAQSAPQGSASAGTANTQKVLGSAGNTPLDSSGTEYTTNILKNQPQGQPPVTVMPKGQEYSPFDIDLKGYDAGRLRKAAALGGIDPATLPDDYFDKMAQHFQQVKNPDTLQAVRNWYSASGLGHFMNGIHDGDGGLGKPDAVAQYIEQQTVNPDVARADKFFNSIVQSRIIDASANNGKGYFDNNGNYDPPLTYKMGKEINDTGNAKLALGGLGAVAGMGAGGKALIKLGIGTAAFMQAHPQAAQVLGQAIKWTAIGKIVTSMGGGRLPPP